MTRSTKSGGAEGLRSIDEVEAELAAARTRLETTVDDLVEALSPRNLAAREVAKVKDFFVDDDGGLRTDHVSKAGGALAGLLALRTIVRRRSR